MSDELDQESRNILKRVERDIATLSEQIRKRGVAVRMEMEKSVARWEKLQETRAASPDLAVAKVETAASRADMRAEMAAKSLAEMTLARGEMAATREKQVLERSSEEVNQRIENLLNKLNNG